MVPHFQACSTRRCTVIQCMVGYLSANDNFLITIKSRLNVRNFIRVSITSSGREQELLQKHKYEINFSAYQI